MFLYRSRMFLWRWSMGKNLLRLAIHISNWRNLTNSWANRFIFSTRDPKFVTKIKKWKGHLNHIDSLLQQKVEGAAFPDDKEPLWSTNFKRSIASILQVDLSGINNYIYSDKEVVLSFFPIIGPIVFIFFPFEMFSVIAVRKMRSQLLLLAYGWEPAQCDKASGLGFVPRVATGSMEDFYRYALVSRRRTAGIMN